MFNLSRRDLLLGSVAAGSALGFGGPLFAQGARPAPPPPARQTGTLIVNTYGGLYERHWRSTLLPDFTAQTGIKPVLDIGVGRIFAANLRASANNTPYSCVLMNENIAAQLRDEGMFEKITVEKVPNYANVLPNFKAPGDLGVTGLLGPIGIGYRTDLVKTKPKSWRDLWDNPEFKGKIGLYQIGAAGAHLFILLAAKMFGGSQDNWEVALKEIQKLQPFPQVDFSGALSTLITRGDVIVAPIDAAEIISLKKKGVPVDLVAPEEGLLAFEIGWYLIKNGPAHEEACKFLNYILDPATQQKLIVGISGTLPANGKTVIPAAVKAEMPIPTESVAHIIKWDWSRTNKQIPEITDAWNRTIR